MFIYFRKRQTEPVEVGACRSLSLSKPELIEAMKLFYVYIIQCKDQSFYVGMTNNLERRFYEHNTGKYKNSYTYRKRPVVLKWFETFTDPNEALKVEKQLKGWSRRKKIALIDQDWENLVEFSKNYTEYNNKIRNDKGSSTSSDQH